jgi:alpha-tubulin suppressor-like RCC1 family protein
VQICSNLYHCAAVTSTGELYTCGDNTEGQVQPSEGMKAEDAPQGDDRWFTVIFAVPSIPSFIHVR